MISKEECENALYELSLITAKDTEDGSCLGCSCTSCLPNDECLNGKLIGTFNKLIKEHFDNPPLKFEELNEGDWVWDNKNHSWLKVIGFYGFNIHVQFGIGIYKNDCYVEYEENRFFRKQMIKGD